jgi:hypothetical protein
MIGNKARLRYTKSVRERIEERTSEAALPSVTYGDYFRQREIRRAVARNRDRFGLALRTFIPCSYRVASVGDIVDFVGPGFVGLGEVRGRRNDNVGLHLWMHVAHQGNGARIIEFETAFFSLRPSAHVVRQPLVAADRTPGDVVRNRVAVLELDGGTLLHRENVRLKQETLLIHGGVAARRCESLPGNRLNVNHRFTSNARNFALDGAGIRSHGDRQCHYYCN